MPDQHPTVSASEQGTGRKGYNAFIVFALAFCLGVAADMMTTRAHREIPAQKSRSHSPMEGEALLDEDRRVTLMNPGGITRHGTHYAFEEPCTARRAGLLQRVGNVDGLESIAGIVGDADMDLFALNPTKDWYLVGYLPPEESAVVGDCPAGTVFFMPVAEFEVITDRFRKVEEARRERAVRMRRLLEGTPWETADH